MVLMQVVVMEQYCGISVMLVGWHSVMVWEQCYGVGEMFWCWINIVMLQQYNAGALLGCWRNVLVLDQYCNARSML